MIPIIKVKDIITRHNDLEKELSSGKIDLEPLVTHHFPLEEIQKGFEFIDDGGDGGTLRAVIQVSS